LRDSKRTSLLQRGGKGKEATRLHARKEKKTGGGTDCRQSDHLQRDGRGRSRNTVQKGCIEYSDVKGIKEEEETKVTFSKGRGEKKIKGNYVFRE